MSHNITEHVSPAVDFTHLDVHSDCWGRKYAAQFRFGSTLDPNHHFSVTVDGQYVPVEGEDLFALRELLNELPEEAFVRPAEPVDSATVWTDGDSFLSVSKLSAVVRYTRHPMGRWSREVLTRGQGLQFHTAVEDLTDDLLNQNRWNTFRIVERQASLGIGTA